MGEAEPAVLLVLSFSLCGGECAVDFVPFIVPLLQEMAFGSHAMEIVAGALMWLELNEWGLRWGCRRYWSLMDG